MTCQENFCSFSLTRKRLLEQVYKKVLPSHRFMKKCVSLQESVTTTLALQLI